MQVFAREGIVKARMIDVARAAGVGKGTVYEYFRSKEEMFAAAYQYLFTAMETAVNHALDSTDDPVQKLHLLMQTSYNVFLHGGGEFAEIMMDFWAEGVRTKDTNILEIINLREIYAEYRKTIGAILADGIKKGVFKPLDVPKVSSALIGFFDGLLLQWIMDPKQIDIQKISDITLEFILNGIKK